MEEICGDNRFEIIEDAKNRLIEATNIESRPDEMSVLDSLLFRMWQMGWLPGCDRAECTCELEEPHEYYPMHLMTCSACGMMTIVAPFCSWCGSKVVE